MRISFQKIKQSARTKNIPLYFERYEFLIVIGGALLVFLIAGILFYFKAYRTVS
ncbi:MAG: hypothetical protein HYS15_03330, partial [Candidatus Spechtbacteria bacterium]|nr:hypothetical protein [Candidatus Spechtbacteria bacterium]